MKTLILIFTLSALTALAGNRSQLNDLDSLKIRQDVKALHTDIHYPNYRMGGGTPPTRAIVDCLVLDVLDSDHFTTLALKKEIAEKIQVLQGFGDSINGKTELLPVESGNKIVFNLLPGNLYMTTISVVTKDGRSFTEVLKDIMPLTRRSNNSAAVNLLYVRDCRL